MRYLNLFPESFVLTLNWFFPLDLTTHKGWASLSPNGCILTTLCAPNVWFVYIFIYIWVYIYIRKNTDIYVYICMSNNQLLRMSILQIKKLWWGKIYLLLLWPCHIYQYFLLQSYMFVVKCIWAPSEYNFTVLNLPTITTATGLFYSIALLLTLRGHYWQNDLITCPPISFTSNTQEQMKVQDIR